mmetsp:Transcript_5418/g.9681  ORF Transcript_5418/g.9681 Transcript_5418/m.9681 type:complete len:349 (+) Transcript_5418:55-1101(+)
MTQWGKVVAINTMQAVGATPIDIQVDDLPQLPSSERNLAEGIKSLYQTCQLYDLNLVVGKTHLPAHKVVLASMSRACCEHVQKAVKEYQQQHQKVEAKEQPEQEKPATEEAPSTSCAEVPTATSPVYSNQWKCQDDSAEPPAVAVIADSNASSTSSDSEKTATPVPAVSDEPSVQPPPSASSTRPELNLDIDNPEAARAFLDLVYGLGTEYNISSDAANKDVLRLATQLDVPCLQESATHFLGQNLTSSNAVDRLQTCKEFGLDEMYQAIEEEVVANKEALSQIASDEEVVKHPGILQGLLIRSASVHQPVPAQDGKEAKRKRVLETKSSKPEKMPKVSAVRSVAGGA